MWTGIREAIICKRHFLRECWLLGASRAILTELTTNRMITMLDILRNRRSIRRYKDREIEKEKIELLKEAALRSPSSRGINPWRSIFITDKALLESLSRAKESGSSFPVSYTHLRAHETPEHLV